MRHSVFFLLSGLFLSTACIGQSVLGKLKTLPENKPTPTTQDWLLNNTSYKAGIYQASGGKDIVLANGLIQRRIRLAPNAATIDFKNLATGQQYIRSVRPEARLVLDGKTYAVGGLYGQTEHAYLREEWVAGFEKNEADFQLVDFSISPLTSSVRLATYHLDDEPANSRPERNSRLHLPHPCPPCGVSGWRCTTRFTTGCPPCASG